MSVALSQEKTEQQQPASRDLPESSEFIDSRNNPPPGVIISSNFSKTNVANTNMSTATGTNVGATGNVGASRSRMPQPGTKNAPFFDKEKPEELHRFFERMEDWFTEDGVTDDKELKKKLVRYTDVDTEQQWKAFEAFTKGTFEDFKKAILASYPKARELTKGSVETLKRKVNGLGPISTSDRDELQELIRIMRTETGKLAKITPPIHTNRELVDIFRGRLDNTFKTMLGMKLIMRREATRMTQPAATPVKGRDPEDLYDLSEIMEIAAELGQENDPFAKHAINTGTVASSESTVKMEELMGKLLDTVNLQNQRSASLEQRLTALQNEQRQANQSRPHAGYATRSGPSNEKDEMANLIAAIKCYYCGKPGHRMNDCEEARIHLDLGWIKRFDNYLKMPDGSSIPRDGYKTLKESVELLQKKGIIPMSKIDKALYQGQPHSISNFVQAGNAETDIEALKMLNEVLQRVGVDTVKRALVSESFMGSQSVGGAEDELEQNFD